MKTRNRYTEVLTVTLVAAACAGLTPALVSAAEIITPTAATSTTTIGGSRTIAYTIDGSDLSAGGSSGDILTETHDQCTDSAGYWLSGDGAGSDTNEVIEFTLPSASDVNAVHLWTYWRGTDSPTRGIKTVDISFSTDGGSTYPTTITGATLGDFLQGDNTAAQSDNETAVQTKTFATQTGVTHIKLTNIINFGNAYIGMSEIRFGGPDAAPAPGSAVYMK